MHSHRKGQCPLERSPLGAQTARIERVVVGHVGHAAADVGLVPVDALADVLVGVVRHLEAKVKVNTKYMANVMTNMGRVVR
eukprot:m.115057 g.115057  ORF g.115057 m.115057 type:complete len:81 (-) comp13552_c0_seq4:669-911(-)